VVFLARPPRRAQVLIGAHALLANGGVMAAVGAQLVALAAQRHAVPFVVLAGLHKLSPLFPHNPAITFNEFKVAPPHGVGLALRGHVPHNPAITFCEFNVALRASAALVAKVCGPAHPPAVQPPNPFSLVARHGRACC